MKNDLFVSVIGFHEKNITRYELPKYMMREKILIRLILSLFLSVFIFTAGYAEVNTGEPSQSMNLVSYDDTVGLFEIRIVSPEMLETVLLNYGKQAVPLKVERGLFIGVLTPGILYLRGDLNEEDFPVRQIIQDSTDEKVGNHLIDITFGRDNSKTELFDNTKEYLIWFDAMYRPEDLQTIREFIEGINDLSQTTRFSDDDIALPSYKPNYNPIPYIYYKISIVDKDLLKEKLDKRDSSKEQILKDNNGVSVALVRNDHLFLLNDLSGDERKHFLLKGLLFSMGFHGESKLQDSFFYNHGIKTVLSPLDKMAIELLYGGRLQSGLDVEAVKKTLGIVSKE